jgi:hypothetical protein
MINAVKEAVHMNDGKKHLAAAFDGSWQKRGHISVNSVVPPASSVTGKVNDFEVLTKYCQGCQIHTRMHQCHVRFDGFS